MDDLKSIFSDEEEEEEEEEEAEEEGDEEAGEESDSDQETAEPPSILTATDVIAVDDGISIDESSDSEVKMREVGLAEGDETLYTLYMADCCAVATFDHETSKRRLGHLAGSNAPLEYFTELAEEISGNITIIIASGTIGSSSHDSFLEGAAWTANRSRIIKAVQHAQKPTDSLNFIPYWTDDKVDPSKGLKPGSFVLTAKGQYGRVKA